MIFITKLLSQIKEVPTWIKLKRLGENKVIRSSYVWVVIVPVLAKLVPILESYLIKAGYSVQVELPFSWHLFYFSALFFAVSSYIYAFKCPFIIRRYENPLDYSTKGRGIRELKAYLSYSIRNYDSDEQEDIMRRFSAIKKVGKVGGDGDNEFNSKYLYVIQTLKNKRKYWRLICSVGYKIGFLLLGIVFFQNVLYVTKEFVNNYIG